MKTLHLLLGAQSLILVVASINRLWDGTDVAVLPHGALRLVDVLNLLVLAPAGVLVFHALLEQLRPGRWARLGFIGAVYLFAASYGMHEAADYLNARFCPGAGELCEIVGYQDDELSHLLFFAGFAGIAAVLLAAQATVPGPVAGGRDRALIAVNAALVAGAIVANLSFDEIGLDLFAVAAVAVLALALWLLRGPRPLILYFGSSYTAGLLLTAVLTMQ
jgi:hypothetical protein